ncbi:MAG: hypothetical protein WCC25_25025 [Candidatus Korobacteraceae bacterium]
MIEQWVQTAALAGLAIEDLVYEPLDPGSYTAEIVNSTAAAYYKPGGLFVFAKVPAGSASLQLGGGNFQDQQYTVTVPAIAPPFSEAGANDLIVIVTALNGGGNNISFNPVIMTSGISSGAAVLASGVSTTLSSTLEPGQVSQAKLASLGTLAVGSIVRIVRNPGLRLKYSPYYTFPNPVTQIIGGVTAGNSGIGLTGVQMTLVSVAGNPVTLTNVAGANVATLATASGTIVLGTARDVTSLTNSNGDYHFYFDLDQPAGSTVVQAALAGFTTQTQTVNASARGRTRADFHLAKA